MTTRNFIKAQLKTIESLKKAIDDIAKSLLKDIPNSESNAALRSFLNDPRGRNSKSATSIYRSLCLSGELDGIELGEQIPACELRTFGGCPNSLELSMPTKDKGKFVAYTGVSDDDTRQAGIMYYTKDGDPLDIALAEIKRGELAKIHGLKSKNEDIEVLLWKDVYTEDYTDDFTLKKEDINNAFIED